MKQPPSTVLDAPVAASPLPSLDTLVRPLADRLADSLPGHRAQEHMAPRHAARRDQLSIKGKTCNQAGVMALLYPSSKDGTPTVLLTVRSSNLPDHAGQVSFPGGRCDTDEPARRTALRETHEEIGVSPSQITVLGSLTPLYIPPSEFCVYPFVGALSQPPEASCATPEVDALLPVPIPHLLDPDTRVIETWTLQGQSIEVPFYPVNEHAVWGATAMMLSELVAVIRSLPRYASSSDESGA